MRPPQPLEASQTPPRIAKLTRRSGSSAFLLVRFDNQDPSRRNASEADTSGPVRLALCHNLPHAILQSAGPLRGYRGSPERPSLLTG